jgi:hypothetical protein
LQILNWQWAQMANNRMLETTFEGWDPCGGVYTKKIPIGKILKSCYWRTMLRIVPSNSVLLTFSLTSPIYALFWRPCIPWVWFSVMWIMHLGIWRLSKFDFLLLESCI